MGLFKKKPSTQDVQEAREYVRRIQDEMREVLVRVRKENRASVELAMVTVLSYMGSGTLSKNANTVLTQEIIQSLKEGHDGKGQQLVPLLLQQISSIFQETLQRRENPVKSVFKKYFEEGTIIGKNICQNPFFQVDVKRTLNRVIEKMMVSSLYGYKFSEEELSYPTPQYYRDRIKAPVKVFTKQEDNSEEYFWRVALVDYKQDIYSFFFSKDDRLILCKELGTMDGGTRIQFFSGSEQEFNEIYDRHDELQLIYSLYDSPLY